MSKYGDADWRLREANELKNSRGVTTLYLPGGRVWCTIRDGECPRPGPGLGAWRCACRGARCCFGGGWGGRSGDAPPYEVEVSKEWDCHQPKVMKLNDADSKGCGLGGGGRGGDAVLAVALPAPRNRCPQDMVDHVGFHHEEALRCLRVRTRVEAEVEATTIPGGGDDDLQNNLSADPVDLASYGPVWSWRAGI